MTGKSALQLKVLPYELTVCQAASLEDIRLSSDFFFIGRTDEELSLVCRTEDVPDHTQSREDGWRAFRVEGVLEFSLTGILSRLSGALAENGIPVFAVSTYNTDYILVKGENLDRAVSALTRDGCEVLPE